jgi:hypothetical protein
LSTVPIFPAAATVKLDGSGNGTARTGPRGSREVWAPAVAAFSVSVPVTNEAQCKIYVGDQPIPANLVDGSLSGSTGDSTGHVGGRLVRLGEYIWAVWTGGDAGSVATLTITGMKQV